jgi:hypothetical protein
MATVWMASSPHSFARAPTRLETRTGLTPAAPAAVTFAQQFAHWRVMYGAPVVSVLGIMNRDCLKDALNPVAKRYWEGDQKGNWTLETASDEEMPLKGQEIRQALMTTRRTLTVLGRGGTKKLVEYNVVEATVVPDAWAWFTYCLYDVTPANEFDQRGMAPEVLKDTEQMSRQVDAVFVSDQAETAATGARFIEKPTRYELRDPARDTTERQRIAALTHVLMRTDVRAFLEADRTDPHGIDYRLDFSVISAQEFDITLDRRHPRKHVWSIKYEWEHMGPQANGPYAKLQVWGLFEGSRQGPQKPIYLWKSDVADWAFHEGFVFASVADLNGDGVEEMIAHRALFEAAGDVILAWENGVPVVVYDSNVR